MPKKKKKKKDIDLSRRSLYSRSISNPDRPFGKQALENTKHILKVIASDIGNVARKAENIASKAAYGKSLKERADAKALRREIRSDPVMSDIVTKSNKRRAADPGWKTYRGLSPWDLQDRPREKQRKADLSVALAQRRAELNPNTKKKRRKKDKPR